MGCVEMNIATILQGVQKIYIDTALFIYFVENHPIYAQKTHNLFSLTQRLYIENNTSTLTITEVLVKPLQLGDLLVVNAYKTLLYETNIVQVHTITSDIAESAADIRVRYNIKTPDALHIATAINTQCDVFVTNDYQLTRIKELRVVILDEIEL